MSREAMQMALHTLEGWANYGKWVWPESALEQAKRNTTESIAALRQALETEQVPVAWITDGGKGELWWYQSSKFDEEGNLIGYNPDDVPLYTAPPKQWVGLTDQEIHEIDGYEEDRKMYRFARAIEAKLREKNT
jgi:hypothetical protein